MKKFTAILCAIALLCSVCVTASADGKFSHAKIDGNFYSSECFGIDCLLGNDWYVANDEELAALVGATKDMITDENLSALIEQSGYFYDFYAEKQTETSSESLNICVEQFDNVLQSLYVKSSSKEAFISELVEELESEGYFDGLLDSIGLEEGAISVGTIPFCGEDTPCIFIYGTIMGIPLYETLVYLVCDDCMGVITASSIFEDTTADILGCFSDYEEVAAA